MGRLVVAAFLSVGVVAFAGPPVSKSEATYRQLELFARVLSYVQNNYVETVDEQQLMQGAIKGMLETLDPHTVYMPPDVFKEMKIDTSGEFGGLGIEIARRNDAIIVVAPIDDTPAPLRLTSKTTAPSSSASSAASVSPSKAIPGKTNVIGAIAATHPPRSLPMPMSPSSKNSAP